MAAEPLGVWSDRKAEPFGSAPLPAASPEFEELYREHFEHLRRFCLGMTGQTTLAEDIAQETLLRAFVRMERLDFDRPMWPWLKKVARRLVYDHSRANREVCSDDPDDTPAAIDDHGDRFAERELLARVLHRLPARQRTAVTLRYLEDWKSAEVAEILDLERPAVEQLLLRARRSLCAEYRRLGGDRLRVALWPLFGLLSRLRDRAARLASVANDLSVSAVARAADTVSMLVVATAVTVSATVGGVSADVAERSPAPVPAIVAPAQRPASAHTLATRSVDVPRELFAPTAGPGAAQASPPRASASAAVPKAAGPVAKAPAGAAPTSSMNVTVGPPTGTSAGSPKAVARVERTPERTIFDGAAEAPVEGTEETWGAAPFVAVDCKTEARKAACDAAEGAIESADAGLPATD